MRDAFLLQMDYFDRLLKLELARMLDPIVAAPPPRPARLGLIVFRPTEQDEVAPAVRPFPRKEGSRQTR